MPLDTGRWHRGYPDRRLAGVASAVSHGLGLPLAAVRVGFIVLGFVHLIGVFLYLLLWLALPGTPGSESPLDRALALLSDVKDTIFDHWRDRHDGGQAPPPPPASPPGGGFAASGFHDGGNAASVARPFDRGAIG